MDNGYNCKILEYADGSGQKKHYNGIIRPKKKKSKPIPLDTEKVLEKPIIIETTMEELYEIALRIEKEQEERAENSLRSSVSRTRAKIEQLARSGNFTHFITITFDRKKVDRYNYDECIKKFTVWLQNIKRVAPNIQALFVPEFHMKNAQIDDTGKEVYAVHFHGLIGQIEGLTLDFYKMRKGQKVFKLTNWAFGISDVTEIVNHNAICRYMRKYITKELVSIARTHKSRHRYFKTGLKPPKETKLLHDSTCADVLQNQFIEKYADDHNLQIVSQMDDFCEYGYRKIKYAELRKKGN